MFSCFLRGAADDAESFDDAKQSTLYKVIESGGIIQWSYIYLSYSLSHNVNNGTANKDVMIL
jgi:hypothetical protein